MSAVFEFTGTKSPKAKHRFTLAGSTILGVAGLWRGGKGNSPKTFTLLTCEPGPEVAPYHNRQIAVLRPLDWAAWLALTKPEAELLAPNSLTVETVRQGKS